MLSITFQHPFNFLFETNGNLLARAYRTTLKQKFSDTLFLFFSLEYMNLFDYATLGIPKLCWKVLLALANELQFISDELFLVRVVINVLILYIPVTLIYFLPSAIFAAISMLIAAPIVLLVHLCTSILSQTIKNDAFQVKIQACEKEETWIEDLFRRRNNRLFNALELGTPVKILALLQTLDDEFKTNECESLEDYTSEKPTITLINGQPIWSILLLKKHDAPFAIIPMGSPKAAYRVSQLARINFAHIG